MDLEIAGEVALVLGGSKGLGFACALELARAGVKVAINGRNAADGAVALMKMKATPIDDMFATGGKIREDGRMVTTCTSSKSRPLEM